MNRGGDVCSFRLIEDQTRRRVLDHLQRFHSTGWLDFFRLHTVDYVPFDCVKDGKLKCCSRIAQAWFDSCFLS